MWDKLNYNLGLIQAGRKQTMTHKFTNGTIDIRSIALGCSCTGYKLDRVNQIITIEFMPGEVPKHIIRKGKDSYGVNKNTVVVSVENGKERIDIFNFKATVKNKI